MAHVEHTITHSGLTGLASKTLRFITAGLIAIGYMVGIPTVSFAVPIVYDVNRVLGTGGVTGTITTDGSIGVGLNANIVTSFALELNNGLSTTTLTGTPATLGAGGPLQVTATEIKYDFTVNGGVNDFVLAEDIGFTATWQINRFLNEDPEEAVKVDGVLLFIPLPSGTTVITIATGGAPIPEPGTIVLFGSGLVGLLAWRRVTRHRRGESLQPLTPQLEA